MINKQLNPLIEDITDAIEQGKLAVRLGSKTNLRTEACAALYTIASFLEEENWPIGTDPSFIAKVLREIAQTTSVRTVS